MRALPGQILILFVLAAAFWQLCAQLMAVREPWDANAYWFVAYPLALILSGLAGRYFKRQGWLAGVVVILAQLPVMWIANGSGPLWLVGLLLLLVLAIPAAAISATTSRIARQPA